MNRKVEACAFCASAGRARLPIAQAPAPPSRARRVVFKPDMFRQPLVATMVSSTKESGFRWTLSISAEALRQAIRNLFGLCACSGLTERAEDLRRSWDARLR